MNSYLTVEEANKYFEFHAYEDEWNSVEESKKDTLLEKASKELDKFNLFYRYKSHKRTSIRIPKKRAGRYTYRSKNATCEMAIYLLLKQKNKSHITNNKLGINSISLNGVSYSYNGNGFIPDEVLDLLKPYINLSGRVF